MSSSQASSHRNTNKSHPFHNTTSSPTTPLTELDSEDEWWEDDEPSPQKPGKKRKSIRITQWPKPPGMGAGANRVSTRTTDRRYSVQKPIRGKSTGRQKKQNAKAGITLVTNLNRYQPARPGPSQANKTTAQTGCFVDLAALQALNGESSGNPSFWRSRKNKAGGVIPIGNSNHHEPQPDQRLPTQNETEAKNSADRSNTSSCRIGDDLSPDDRPIVIGLSIPTGDASSNTFSPLTAASETTRIVRSYEHRTPTTLSPETPTIIITPAQSVSLWSMLDNNDYPDSQVRPSSSVYGISTDAPPMPQMPNSILIEERNRLAGLKSYFSPDSDDATMWEDDESPAKSRVVSTGTIFEDDDSPILTKGGRARSMSGASRSTRHLSISTRKSRAHSTGWWNYITTPFLTRSNTFAQRDVENHPVPAVPSLASAVAKLQDEERDGTIWEKQFSPLTPETSTSTVLSTDQWWNPDLKQNPSVEPSPVLQETRHQVQESTGTLAIIFPERAGFETASTHSQIEPEELRKSTLSSFAPTMQTPPDGKHIEQSDQHERHSRGVAPQPQNITVNIHSASTQIIQPLRATIVDGTAASSVPAGTTPPPPYSPSPTQVRKYRAVFPPGHALGIQYPASPGPVSPGLQNAMSSGGAIPLSNVPLTPPPARRPINLNSGYPSTPSNEEAARFAPTYLQPVSKKAQRAEAKRQRHEKEDHIARRAGGLWRGRGCIPKRGCYGRDGAEGRKRRRWYLGLSAGFLLVIILIIVLATQLHRKSNPIIEPSQWLNLTGFPPIFVGVSTVIAPINIKTNTGCVFPATQWSCDLPKELHASVAPNQSNQPNFLMRIQWDNSSLANETFANVTKSPKLANRSVGNPVTAGQFMKHLILKARQAVLFVPDPEPPSVSEDFFLGSTTDGIVAPNKAGEATPFYISFLQKEESRNEKRELSTRQTKNPSDFPDLESIIPPPSLNLDGTAAPANLLPLPNQQPIRLYDRGLPTEHYGFYTYYDRSIFLKSVTSLNETNLKEGSVPDDRNGGAKEGEAKFRCTWTQTRFLVQMWTRMNTTTRLLNSTRFSSQNAGSGSANFSAASLDFTQPGSFPYPVTFTIDRHGGDPKLKMLYCYTMDDRRGLIAKSVQIHDENRGFGGTLINRAPSFFRNDSDASLGGFDGGNGGCGCKWRNFEDVVRV